MLNMLASLLVVALLGFQGSSAVDPATACAGYEISIEKLKVCDGVPSLLTHENFNAVLQDNCTVTTSGCIAFDGFTTAKVNYTLNIGAVASSAIKKALPNFPLESNDNTDGCPVFHMIADGYHHYFTDLGLPISCPVTGRRLCANNDTTNSHFLNDLAKDPKHNMQAYLAMAVGVGYTSGRFSAVHDTGVTCFEFGGRMKMKNPMKNPMKKGSFDKFKLKTKPRKL